MHQTLTYGPSKMGHDVETDETYFLTEIMVNGKNSGMFVNRSLYPIMKQFLGDLKDPHVKSAFVKTTLGQMMSTALFPVDEYSLTDFIAREISSAK